MEWEHKLPDGLTPAKHSCHVAKQINKKLKFQTYLFWLDKTWRYHRTRVFTVSSEKNTYDKRQRHDDIQLVSKTPIDKGGNRRKLFFDLVCNKDKTFFMSNCTVSKAIFFWSYLQQGFFGGNFASCSKLVQFFSLLNLVWPVIDCWALLNLISGVSLKRKICQRKLKSVLFYWKKCRIISWVWSNFWNKSASLRVQGYLSLLNCLMRDLKCQLICSEPKIHDFVYVSQHWPGNKASKPTMLNQLNEKNYLLVLSECES